MLRWLRFAFYASLVGVVLARNADAIRQSLRVLASGAMWAPTVACIPCALGLLALCAAYLAWLSGATLAGWRMPVLIHLAPIALLAVVLLRGPLLRPVDPWANQGPPDRALAAMRGLRLGLPDLRQSPCQRGEAGLQPLLEKSQIPPTGYRAHGRALPFRVQVRPNEAGPIREPEAGALPGTLYLSCDREGRRFWMTAVLSETLPEGRPAMLRDGVGRPVVVTGEVEP